MTCKDAATLNSAGLVLLEGAELDGSHSSCETPGVIVQNSVWIRRAGNCLEEGPVSREDP